MYQSLTIIGNLGRDPEMRYTPSGQAVTSFSVATSRTFTTQGGEQSKETVWFRVSAWGKTAEACKTYLHKGSKVLVVGRLTPDKETGNPRVYKNKEETYSASFDVTAQEVKFLGGDKGDKPAPAELQDEEPF